jgi:hypothetical protein
MLASRPAAREQPGARHLRDRHQELLAGRKATADDNASADSRVNQNISAPNTSFVAFSLPILLDGSSVLHHDRDPALPFYKYLKKYALARQRLVTCSTPCDSS